jgi:hypothetical protein
MQLSQRPSKETVNELEKEYNHLELLLQGTQKENERCMRELDTYVPSATAILLIFDPYAAGPDPGKSNSRKRSRSSLGRIGGWVIRCEFGLWFADYVSTQDNLEVAPNAFAARTAAITRGQNASASNTSLTATPMPPSGNSAETVAQMEQIRLLIMGMEKRLESHEEKFGRSVERAEHEGRKFQELRKELHLMGTSWVLLLLALPSGLGFLQLGMVDV